MWLIVPRFNGWNSLLIQEHAAELLLFHSDFTNIISGEKPNGIVLSLDDDQSNRIASEVVRGASEVVQGASELAKV
ncbi:hypothetical protein L1887_23554 [Cichorium endivia]|nr:hypothetical protein L1887_23554 [Cichorium endivia]